MEHLRTTSRRADVRLLVLALVSGVLLAASAGAPGPLVAESAQTARPAPAVPSPSGEAEPPASPLADTERTRAVDGSVGPDAAESSPEREPEATDGVADDDVAEPIPSGFGRRPAVAGGDSPDPQIIWSEGEYVVFSTNSDGRNVPMRTSVDLATWSDPVDAVTALPAWGSPDLTWAPTAAQIGGQWVLYAAVLHRTAGVHCVAAFTSPVATGPYVPAAEPVRCSPQGMIDPFILSDEGRHHLYWKAVGGRERQIFGIALRPDGLATVGRPVHLATATASWEGGGVENPTMVRTGGRYLLFYSANWWTGSRYAIGYAVCESPLGTCTKATKTQPWLASTAGVNGPGGQSFTLGPDGRVWMAYHAWTPTIGYGRGGQRQLHVEPVVLNDGRPVVDNRAPFGALEDLVPWPGGMLLKGWVADPDDTTPIAARVTVDGAMVAEVTASRTSATAWESFVLGGPFHGVFDPVPVLPGRHEVCLVAVDDRGGLDTVVGCRVVDISGTPIGAQTQFIRNSDRTITVRGWALDPQTAGPATVEATIAGKVVTSVADRPVPGLGGLFLGYGDDHGFDLRVSVPPGNHSLCVNVQAPWRATARIACTPVSGAAPPTTTTTTRPPRPTTTSSTSTTVAESAT
jgi:GH43 family beta-xylosidase